MSEGILHGLLYADDIVSLHDSIDKLKEFLKEFLNWCKFWWMEISVVKSGVMLWTANDELRRQFNQTIIDTEEGVIDKVDKYKYLGVTADGTLPTSRMVISGMSTNEDNYVKSLAKKGVDTLHQLRPVLIDPLCPVHLKVMLIRTFLIPKMQYGSEWIGLRRLNSDPLQRVVNVALHWAIGLKGKSNITDSNVILMEFGIPSMEEIQAASRARLYYKTTAPNESNTWLNRLSKSEKKSTKASSWVFTSRTELSKILKQKDKYGNDFTVANNENVNLKKSGPVPLRPWAMVGMMLENHVKSNTYRSPLLMELRELYKMHDFGATGWTGVEDIHTTILRTSAFAFDAGYERLLQTEAMNARTKSQPRWLSEKIRLVRECVWERRMSSNNSVSFEGWYDKYGFGATRGYIRSAVRRPDLLQGVLHLISIRVRTFPEVEKTWLKAKFAGRSVQDYRRHSCPLCGDNVSPGWDWAHILLGCEFPRVVACRKKVLDQAITLVEDELLNTRELKNHETPAGLGNYRINSAVLAIYLVGGTVNDHYGSSYTIGFGATEIMPISMKTFGYVPIAEFLKEVVPEYTSEMKVEKDDLLLEVEIL